MLTLGQLISELKDIQKHQIKLCKIKDRKEDIRVWFDFPNVYPTIIASWRGAYAEPALGYNLATYGEEDNAPTLDNLIEELEMSMTRSYEGWKGGSFYYDKNSPLHVDNIGQCNEQVITGVECDGYEVILKTTEESLW